MPTGFPNTLTKCVIEGCDGTESLVRGWCRMHYARWRRNGDPRGRQSTLEYTGAHNRVIKAKGRARDHRCAACGQPAKQWAYDHSDPNEQRSERRGFPFSANPDHYQPMCVPCHKRFDQENSVDGLPSPVWPAQNPAGAGD